MATADFFRINQQAPVLSEVAIDKESKALENKPKKPVTENLNHEQLNQVDKSRRLEQKTAIPLESNSREADSTNKNSSSEVADFFRINQQARTTDSDDEKKANSVLSEVDIDKESKALQNNPKKPVTENLNHEQLNQVDKIVQKLRGRRLEQKTAIPLESNSREADSTNKNSSSEVLKNLNSDYENGSFLQLDEKSLRKEIQEELKNFNIADFRVNENGSLIDPSKYYKFLALRERAGGLGMETEFNKMEAAIENIKYQELEKYSRKFIDEKSTTELQNKTTSSELDYRETSFNEDLKQLMVSVKNFRDSLTNAIACGVIEAVKRLTNQGEIEQYVVKDPDSAESKDFLNNLGKVVYRLHKIGLKTNIEKDQETGAQYIEADLPANYKGSTDIAKLDLQDIEKSIRDSLSPSKSKNESENTEKKAPKLRILVNSVLAIQKLKKAQEKNNQNSHNSSENTEQDQDKRPVEIDLRGGDFSNIKELLKKFGQMNDQHSDLEETNKNKITNSSEVGASKIVGKYTKNLLETRSEKRERVEKAENSSKAKKEPDASKIVGKYTKNLLETNDQSKERGGSNQI